jgi:DNA-binding NtrC family response regulator
MAELERRYIEFLLERHQGNQSAVARVMGVSRNTVGRKLSG